MKINWSKIGQAWSSFLISLLLGVVVLIPLILYVSLSGFPPYITKALMGLGPAFLLAIAVAGSGLVQSRGCRRVWMLFLTVCLVTAGYVGHGVWRDHLPTVDDRALLLQEYEPFKAGTRAVTLEEPSTLQMKDTAVRRLRLDGATALYPVYASFVQVVYPEEDYRETQVACSGTVTAYERLLDREVDMIFAAAPSQAQLEAAERKGLELHLVPIGREAFVFFVNSKNPVTGLTVEQIQGIYSGRITNWKEVGGRNQSIRPFQRAENSGSQSALQRLMEGIPLMEPEEEDVVSAMDGIIRQVASYRNYKNAIGFSFRFYATEMVSSNEIRLLALNGVEPTKETIRDGSYPISSAFYAVTASPKGHPAAKDTDEDLAALLDWTLSPQGQSIVEKAGYVALS